ncbi:hypothetical protein Dimus_033552 [Dionaea muscipula]
MEEEAGSNCEVQWLDLVASTQGPASIEASRTSLASSTDLISSSEALTSIAELHQASSLSSGVAERELGEMMPLLTEEVHEVAMEVGLSMVDEDDAQAKVTFGDGRGSDGLGSLDATQMMNGDASEVDDGFRVSDVVLCRCTGFCHCPVAAVTVSSPGLAMECPLPVQGGLADGEDSQSLPDVVSPSVSGGSGPMVCSSVPLVPDAAVHNGRGKVGVVSDEGSSFVNDVGGMVREEVLVTPAASAALRPQPADGLRQPPLSPVEPAVVARSGPRVLSAVGLPGYGAATPGARSFATRAVAQSQLPPTVSSSLRVGTGGATDRSTLLRDDQGWQQSQSRRGRASVGSSRGQQVEGMGRTVSGVAHPRLIWSFDSAKHRDLRVRSVVERLMKEGLCSEEEDVQPDLPSFAVVEVNRLEGSTLVDVRDSIEVCPPDLGVAPSSEDELLPADGGQRSSEQALQEGVDLSGGSDLAICVGLVATVTSGGVSAIVGCAKLPQTEGLEDEGLPELQPLAGDDGEREKGLGATVASSDAPVVASDGGAEDLGESQGWATSQTRVEDEGGEQGVFSADALCSPHAQVRSLAMVSLPVLDLESSSSSAMATALPGRLGEVLDAAISVDRLLPGNSVSPFAATCVDCLCPHGDVIGSVESSRVFVDDGGLVSEEILVTPVASAALRPQPADGLRQPPLSPVELVVVDRSGPGVFSAVGLPGCGVVTPGVSSFATVVNPDPQADVELSCDPPTDGGNVVVMTDTDGLEDEWRACLIASMQAVRELRPRPLRQRLQ